jgi:hypothetical protein
MGTRVNKHIAFLACFGEIAEMGIGSGHLLRCWRKTAQPENKHWAFVRTLIVPWAPKPGHFFTT